MPPKRRYAVAGEPDFHNVSDERLKSFMDCAQQMIFAYKGFDDAKVKVMKEIWHDLMLESNERLVVTALVDKEEKVVAPAPVLGKAPKLRKSPAKRKI